MKDKASIIDSLSVILAILTVIGGIVLAITLESFWYLIPSMLVAWLDYILLSSYADLLNTTADTNEMVKTLMKGQSDSQKNKNQFTAKAQEPTAIARDEKPSKADPAPISKVESTTVTADPNNTNYIICNNCGTRQKANRLLCFNCGAKFKD